MVLATEIQSKCDPLNLENNSSLDGDFLSFVLTDLLGYFEGRRQPTSMLVPQILKL